jgi:hypothetical protein
MEDNVISEEVWRRAWAHLDLRQWLKDLGLSPFVPMSSAIPLVHLYEEQGHELMFNEDYSAVTVIREGSKVEAPCVQSRVRVDGIRAALTCSVLYVHHAKEGL